MVIGTEAPCLWWKGFTDSLHPKNRVGTILAQAFGIKPWVDKSALFYGWYYDITGKIEYCANSTLLIKLENGQLARIELESPIKLKNQCITTLRNLIFIGASSVGLLFRERRGPRFVAAQ